MREQKDINMQITEKDIFNFVFFPENVSTEIKLFLEESRDFKNEIDLYESMKNSLADDLSDKTKNKIASKIEVYKPSNVIHLFPVKGNQNNRYVNKIRLAAASLEEKPKITSKTFYDENMTYIIKVLNYENRSKIFVFSPQYELIKDFELIISPQNLKYHIKDNTSPLELDMNIDPELISLEFNLTKRT